MPSPVPLVDVAVVSDLDRTGTELLFDFDPKWGAFVLPVTRVAAPASDATAVEAAAEVLGTPPALGAPPRRIGNPVPAYQISFRDGEAERYQFFPFALRGPADPRPLAGHVAVWPTPDEGRTHAPHVAQRRVPARPCALPHEYGRAEGCCRVLTHEPGGAVCFVAQAFLSVRHRASDQHRQECLCHKKTGGGHRVGRVNPSRARP